MKKIEAGYTLANVDDLDVSDVIVKLEKSFGLNFRKDAFIDVNTFGEFCDVFADYINYEDRNDCTTQQAFYRVRIAAAGTLQISQEQIIHDTKLSELFPLRNRRKNIKQFRRSLGVDIKLLTYPGWLGLIFLVGIIGFLAAFFFDWKIALCGLVFIWIAHKIADSLGTVIKFETIRELTGQLKREHYIEVRRAGNTANRNEIEEVILDTFSTNLGVEKVFLTRDAKFGWAK